MDQPNATISDQEIIDTQLTHWHDFLRDCQTMGLWFIALQRSETGFEPFQLSTTRQGYIGVREIDLREIIL